MSIPRAIAIAVLMAASVAACGSGDRPLAEVDPNAVPIHPTFDEVNAIFYSACVPCHDGKADPPLATCQDITDEIDESYGTIVSNTMPPGALPRLSAAEKLTIERWIGDGAPSPCD